MRSLRNFVLTAALISLGGCTAFSSFSEVDALNEAQAIGSPFTQALADEYRNFANSELKEMFDYPDALHFARKGLAAASGEIVQPEPVSDWNLRENHIMELSAARGRLLVTFDLGAREVAPAAAALAQYNFDCWIEQQEENWQDDEILACKEKFFENIAILEGMIQPPPAPAPEIVEQEAEGFIDPSLPMAPENAVYLVFFNWDASNLSSDALSVLDAVADEIKNNPPEQVTLSGHADTSGPQSYNDKLAFRRAKNVRDALVERGLDEELFLLESKGESDPMVPTADNVKEPANRRVMISFQ